MSQPWYENKRWTNIGMIETGKHSIYEFEVYIDESTNEVQFCDHDDPDEPVYLNGLIAFDMEQDDGREDDEVNLEQQFLGLLITYTGE